MSGVKFSPFFGDEKGLGLIEVMVAAGLGMVVIAGLAASNKVNSAMSRKTESSLALSGIKAGIIQNLDCRRTLEPLVAGGACQTPTYITLRNAKGGVLAAADGTSKSGAWTIRARCDRSGVEVRAAKLRDASAIDFDAGYPAGSFIADEMNSSLPYGWSHPKASLFAADSVGPCSTWFGAAASSSPSPVENPSSSGIAACGPGQYMRGLDRGTMTPVCGDIPSCMVLSYDADEGFSCSNPATWFPNGKRKPKHLRH